MKVNPAAKHYGRLTPEERFRLILAAGARDDHSEQDRLVAAGQRIALSVRDHTLYALAFSEVDHFVYAELLASAADYLELMGLVTDHCLSGDGGDTPEADGSGDEREPVGDIDQEEMEDRDVDLAQAFGFMLKVKGDGWKLFCQRMSVPPFAMWTFMPGYGRLECALKIAENVAFTSEEMLQYVNRRRREGLPELPELTTVPFTVEATAADHERLFREFVSRWGRE